MAKKSEKAGGVEELEKDLKETEELLAQAREDLRLALEGRKQAEDQVESWKKAFDQMVEACDQVVKQWNAAMEQRGTADQDLLRTKAILQKVLAEYAGKNWRSSTEAEIRKVLHPT